ncbi:hypothetical protein Nepgr_011931 [Nepenthes gracilis]|uniref:Uncharacterized protein n=1 Tax=Nepenthes gracilis TaxID=150966 RepID=A0AAD3SFZ7_NEPGR|nr:hypothetical protein Nepgr_011931 [Nepenthes gracilis]
MGREMKTSSYSSKPISSPGRAEKFPPPLMRFLRSNAGSRSRGRSRASPIFSRKKTEAAAIETQEPSSPKVTCIGQVRVRRSRPGPKPEPRKTTGKSGCYCVRMALFCGFINLKLLARSVRKCVFIFHCRSVKIRTDSLKNGKNLVGEISGKDEDEDHEIRLDERVACAEFVSSSSTPPKNALLLTRSRSAPYRSSSLANRFWESPLTTGEARKTEQENRGTTESTSTPTLENELIRRDSEAGFRTGQENDGYLGFRGEIEGSNEDLSVRNSPDGVLKTEEGGFKARVLTLKRCNSEPARGSLNSDPEGSVVRRDRRFGFTECSTPHVDD